MLAKDAVLRRWEMLSRLLTVGAADPDAVRSERARDPEPRRS